MGEGIPPSTKNSTHISSVKKTMDASIEWRGPMGDDSVRMRVGLPPSCLPALRPCQQPALSVPPPPPSVLTTTAGAR
jgi:hypothetical protein